MSSTLPAEMVERQSLIRNQNHAQGDVADEWIPNEELPSPILAPVSTSWAPLGVLPPFVPGIEGMRGIAVVMTHMCHILSSKGSSSPLADSLGRIGVAIFFVLSGFLITGTLLHLQESYKGRYTHLPRFYMDRNARLYPALIFMMAITTILLAAWKNWQLNRADGLRASLALTYLFNLRRSFPVSGGLYLHCWSLAVEEQFYIGWSLALPFIAKASMRTRKTVLGSVIVGSFIVYVVVYFAMTRSPLLIFEKASLAANMWKMIAGASLRLVPIPQSFRGSRTLPVGFLLLFVTILVSLQKTPFLILVEPGAVAVAIAFIMASVRNGGGEVAILSWPSVRFMGKISYGWYLWQLPIQRLSGWDGADAKHPYFGALCATSAAFVVAMVSTFMVEEPVRTWYKGLKSKKTAASS